MMFAACGPTPQPLSPPWGEGLGCGAASGEVPAMRRLLVSFLAVLLFVPVARAHPVPKTNRDRTIVVHVTAQALVVDYRLELDEASIPNELTKEELAAVTTRAGLLETFTRSFADTTCRTLDASL